MASAFWNADSQIDSRQSQHRIREETYHHVAKNLPIPLGKGLLPHRHRGSSVKSSRYAAAEAAKQFNTPPCLYSSTPQPLAQGCGPESVHPKTSIRAPMRLCDHPTPAIAFLPHIVKILLLQYTLYPQKDYRNYVLHPPLAQTWANGNRTVTSCDGRPSCHPVKPPLMAISRSSSPQAPVCSAPP